MAGDLTPLASLASGRLNVWACGHPKSNQRPPQSVHSGAATFTAVDTFAAKRLSTTTAEAADVLAKCMPSPAAR
ncbi:MAG: hypothetical protein AAFQ42_02040, partial [Pseudomonadota bacterium]